MNTDNQIHTLTDTNSLTDHRILTNSDYTDTRSICTDMDRHLPIILRIPILDIHRTDGHIFCIDLQLENNGSQNNPSIPHNLPI